MPVHGRNVLTTYDEILYPTGAFDQTHPSRLATLAALFGMSPAPVERCRVLELGCGAGGNLLPMAEALPGSTFTGIDFAARAIAQGQAWQARIGLDNLTLSCADVLDFEPEPGGYDYIIAHGLYSWVPPAVQDKILAVLRRGLAPDGVGYVSYNALPGGYLRRAVRDIMRFHTRGIDEPERRLAQARAVAAFVAGGSPEAAGSYKQVMEAQRDRIGLLANDYLFHDDLGEHNEALYFHELVARASRHELQYLAEAEFADMQTQAYPPEVRRTLSGAGGIVEQEQYLDFLSGRSFRRTLLVHDRVELDRKLVGARARLFHFLGNAVPASKDPDVRSDAVERFTNPSGVTMGLNGPLAKAAMVILWEHRPCALSFDELIAAVRERLGAERGYAGETGEQELGELLLAAYGGDMVALHRYQPRVVKVPGERPVARRLARAQAAEGPEVTDLWHGNVKVRDARLRQLLTLLDGTRDRAALRETAGEGVEEMLAKLGWMALLES